MALGGVAGPGPCPVGRGAVRGSAGPGDLGIGPEAVEGVCARTCWATISVMIWL